jgi:hypothetical protein
VRNRINARIITATARHRSAARSRPLCLLWPLVNNDSDERKAMAAVSYEELDQLVCELLPERTVLSLINASFTNVNYTTYTFPAHGGGGHGTTVAYACQATNSPGTSGLLASLGLASQNPYSSMTCMPAAVVSR